MLVKKTKQKDVLLIVPDVFEDYRGWYIETFNKKKYYSMFKEFGIDIEFVQDDISVSYKNVLRGIHGDDHTWKLISCLQGMFYVVVITCDPTDKKFGEWQSFRISGENRYQLLIPPMYGLAIESMEDFSIFHYKQSAYYTGEQFTIPYDDDALKIFWPIKNPIVSKRDRC